MSRPGAVVPALLLTLVVVPAPGAAADFEHAEVVIRDGSYRYRFETIIAAAPAAVGRVIADHENFHALNDSFIASRILDRHADGSLTRRLDVRKCVLIFCFDLVMMETVRHEGAGFVATIVPAESSFRNGVTRWHSEPAGNGRTRLVISGEQTPAFWIPPVLGPWILRGQLLREARETCDGIETRARGG